MKRKANCDGPMISELSLMSAVGVTEIKAAEGEAPKRPTFAINAYGGGQIKVQGISRPIVIDLAGLRANSTIPILLDHDLEQIIGQADDVSIAAESVTLSGKITGDDGAATKVLAHARNGFNWAASVGICVDKTESIGAKEKAIVNGKKHTGPLLVVRSARLGEVSFVAIGADETASVKIAASGKGATNMADELELKEGDGGTDSPPHEVDVILAAEKARQKREAEYARITADAIQRFPNERTLKIIEDLTTLARAQQWEPRDLELSILRAMRPTVDNRHYPPETELPATSEMMEAALCVAGMMPTLEKHFDEKTLQASHDRWPKGLGLDECIVTFARRNGYKSLSARQNPSSAIRAAFQAVPDIGIRAAGPSVLSLPGILSNVADKRLADGFNFVDQSWRQIASTRASRNFQTTLTASLTGNQEMQKLSPGGSIQHGTVGEETYTNKVETYAIMFTLDRQVIVNDDLNALMQLPFMQGVGAGRALCKRFWNVFLNNSAFFHANHANVATGAGSALNLTGLTAAELIFMSQTTPDGFPLGVQPMVLLVPTALNAAALNIYQSEEIRDTTSSTRIGTRNIYRGRFAVVSSPYMHNSAFTGASAAAWYLLADPAQLSTVEVAFLNGKDSPTVESTEAMFDQLGIQTRGFIDFGVNLQEYRAGVRSAGA